MIDVSARAAVGHLAISLALLIGCGSGPSYVSPEDFPGTQAPWSSLTYQLPARASVVFLASLDATARAELSEVFETVDAVSGDLGELSDILGVDLSSPAAFDQLGLLPDGGVALSIEGGFWLFLADLANPSATRRVLDEMGARNPDLLMSWREVGGADVLGIVLPDGRGIVARLHVLLTDTQLVVLMDQHPVADTAGADEYLMRHRAPLANNIRFNRNFADAVADLGGDAWAIYVVEVPALFEVMATLGASPTAPLERDLEVGEELLDVGGLFGPPPPAERCAEVTDAMGIAVPVIDGIVEREPAAEAGRTYEHQTMRWHVAPAYHQRASRLLAAPHLDKGTLANGPLLAGFARLDRDVMAEHLAPFQDAIGCGLPASLAGALGQAGQLLAESDVIGSQVDGLVTGALFDFRNAGGVPFVDVFVGLGAAEPASLSQSVQRLLESELGLNGTPEVVGRHQTVHYRFALLYRLAVIEGARLLGITMGLVEQQWIEALLTPTESDAGEFFWLRMDGDAMQPVYDTIVDLALAGTDDETVAETQQSFMDEALESLRRLHYFELSGRYEDGSVIIELDQVTDE